MGATEIPETTFPTCPEIDGVPFDPLDAKQVGNPWPWLAKARREAPVFYLPKYGVWCITRYEDAMTVMRGPETFSSANAFKWRPLPPVLQEVYPDGHPGTRSMIMKDPPEHTRIRKLGQRALTPKRVHDLEPRVRERSHALIDSFTASGRCELVSQYSALLPVQVITDIIGAPLDKDLAFFQWGRDHFTLVEGAPELTDEQWEEIAARARPFVTWLTEFVDSHRANPGDDFVSTLIYATTDDGEPALSTPEVIGIINSFLVAGTETTAVSVPLVLRELLRHPEQWEAVKDDPSLIPRAVEEGLRYCSPARGTRRLVTRDTVLGGVTLPAGAEIHIMLGSAQRDERVFDEPDRFDIFRTDVDKHTGFGKGVHMCLGAPLGRVELRIALETLIERLGDIRLADGQGEEWTPHMSLPRFNYLYIEWSTA